MTKHKRNNLLHNETNNNPEIQNNNNKQDSLSYKLCIDIARDEYRIERERTRVIENKAQIFLTLSFALLSFITNAASISYMVKFYNNISDLTAIIVVTISIVFVFFAVLLIFFATYLLYKTISTKPFVRISIKNILKKEIFKRNRYVL